MSEKQYDLYFSKIVYYENHYPDNSTRYYCVLHGDPLIDGEIVEVKWKNGNIEKYEIKIKVETSNWNKKDVPYGILKYNDEESLVCIENLMARRLYEPKSNKWQSK
mgnify:CR=1 FL=1